MYKQPCTFILDIRRYRVVRNDLKYLLIICFFRSFRLTDTADTIITLAICCWTIKYSSIINCSNLSSFDMIEIIQYIIVAQIRSLSLLYFPITQKEWGQMKMQLSHGLITSHVKKPINKKQNPLKISLSQTAGLNPAIYQNFDSWHGCLLLPEVLWYNVLIAWCLKSPTAAVSREFNSNRQKWWKYLMGFDKWLTTSMIKYQSSLVSFLSSLLLFCILLLQNHPYSSHLASHKDCVYG